MLDVQIGDVLTMKKIIPVVKIVFWFCGSEWILRSVVWDAAVK